MSGNDRIRVVIADDQELVRAGFAMVIGSQPDMDVVGQAGDGDRAVALAERLHPDVVLMDVRMPGMDGIEATRRIISTDTNTSTDTSTSTSTSTDDAGAVAGSGTSDAGDEAPRAHTTRVIILTTFDLDEYVMAAINAGASGFLLKDTEPETLLNSIRTVFRGDAVIAPSATKRLIERMFADGRASGPATGTVAADHASAGSPTSNASDGSDASNGSDAHARPVYTDPELELLTDREREVLVEVAHGLSNQEIADKLFISLPTVKTHVAHILAKINARDRVQAVVFAYDNRLV